MRADKNIQIRKLKTARGQIEGLIKMMEEDRYCLDISNQLLAVISILKNVNTDILKSHIEGCVKEAYNKDENEVNEKMEEIVTLITKLSK